MVNRHVSPDEPVANLYSETLDVGGGSCSGGQVFFHEDWLTTFWRSPSGRVLAGTADGVI
jgi:hypothetical protein